MTFHLGVPSSYTSSAGSGSRTTSFRTDDIAVQIDSSAWTSAQRAISAPLSQARKIPFLALFASLAGARASGLRPETTMRDMLFQRGALASAPLPQLRCRL